MFWFLSVSVDGQTMDDTYLIPHTVHEVKLEHPGFGASVGTESSRWYRGPAD